MIDESAELALVLKRGRKATSQPHNVGVSALHTWACVFLILWFMMSPELDGYANAAGQPGD